MSLYRRSIWFRIILDNNLLLDLKYHPFIPSPSHSIQIEANIPKQTKAQYTPRNGRRREPWDYELCFLRIAAFGRNPRSNDWVCTSDCENECACDAGVRIEIGLFPPAFSTAKSQLQHSDGDGAPEDRNYCVGVEVDEDSICGGGIEVECREDHDDGEDPVQEKCTERCFLRVLFRLHPFLSQQPVEIPSEEWMIAIFDPV